MAPKSIHFAFPIPPSCSRAQCLLVALPSPGHRRPLRRYALCSSGDRQASRGEPRDAAAAGCRQGSTNSGIACHALHSNHEHVEPAFIRDLVVHFRSCCRANWIQKSGTYGRLVVKTRRRHSLSGNWTSPRSRRKSVLGPRRRTCDRRFQNPRLGTPRARRPRSG